MMRVRAYKQVLTFSHTRTKKKKGSEISETIPGQCGLIVPGWGACGEAAMQAR